ncbi:MAG: hypothetical protein P4N59_10225 [Negativicutes bacterium]|nr:hypothetical protein [Negativicutes bacterium]
MKLLIVALALAAVCKAQTAVYGHNDRYLLPDRKVTPGAINPKIVADPSGKSIMVNGVEANVCAKSFSSDPYRTSTEAMNRQVCETYEVKGCPSAEKGQFDHLIPLQIGGADAINNLWWQPEPDHTVKTQVEGTLKDLICTGRISLQFAQQCMQHNWVNCMWATDSLKNCANCTLTVSPNIKTQR